MGPCGGMYMANTTSSVFKAMGMSLPYVRNTAIFDGRTTAAASSKP